MNLQGIPVCVTVPVGVCVQTLFCFGHYVVTLLVTLSHTLLSKNSKVQYVKKKVLNSQKFTKIINKM